MKNAKPISLVSGLVLSFSTFFYSQMATAGTLVTLATTGITIFASSGTHMGDDYLSDDEKAEVEAKVDNDFGSEDELLAHAETITQKNLDALATKRTTASKMNNEVLAKEISNKLFYKQTVKTRAAQIAAARKTRAS